MPALRTMMSINDCCHHLEDFKSNYLETFKILHEVFVVCSHNTAKNVKLKNAFCHVCKKLGPYLHACLQCVFFGCHKHARDHVRYQKHRFSMDLIYGQVHCTRCNDYIYDDDLDNTVTDNTLMAKKCSKKLLPWSMLSDSPADFEDVVDANSRRICITPDSTIGLRGLVNLGKTCFMNCIVQALIHTPLLRDYFLSERHKCNETPGTCFVCELSHIFQEFYRGHRAPLALNKLLLLTWDHAPHLSGNEQKDAHEFFIAMLNALHQNCVDAMAPIYPMPSLDEHHKCPCIIDQIFTGELQSDVICQLCKSVSTTIDPTWDFSLSLEATSANGGSPSSLIDCLERFTRAEHLDSAGDGKYLCSNCNSRQESTKQLTIKSMPIVVNFHLKRFEKTNEIERKISTLVTFPEMLDMTPFMSCHKDLASSNNKYSRSVIPIDNRYSLFAVVNHDGNSIHLGHYTAYVRQQRDFWYMCDDHMIKRASLQEVLASEGYMIFYHKHILEYE